MQVPGPGRWQVPGARLCGLTRGARLEAGWGAPESADCRQGALLPARRVLHGPTQRFRKRENARLASVRECDAFFLVKRSSCDDFLCVDATHHQMEQVEAPWAGRERGRLQRWGAAHPARTSAGGAAQGRLERARGQSAAQLTRWGGHRSAAGRTRTEQGLPAPQVTQLYVPASRHAWRFRRMGRIGPLQSSLDGESRAAPPTPPCSVSAALHAVAVALPV